MKTIGRTLPSKKNKNKKQTTTKFTKSIWRWLIVTLIANMVIIISLRNLYNKDLRYIGMNCLHVPAWLHASLDQGSGAEGLGGPEGGGQSSSLIQFFLNNSWLIIGSFSMVTNERVGSEEGGRCAVWLVYCKQVLTHSHTLTLQITQKYLWLECVCVRVVGV